MCFDVDSAPPIPALSGAAVSHDDLTLEAADGNRFAAFAATPEEPARVGVVILPDVRGLYRFYEELALRFAERGHAAVAFDYFGRTAGAEKRGADFEYMPHVQQTTPEGIQADVAGCVAYLRDARVRNHLHARLLLGWEALVARGRLGPRARRRDRVLRATRPGQRRLAGPGATRRRDDRADPRAAGRRRSRDPRRGLGGVRRGARCGRQSSTRSSSTPAHRTASSTASTRSSPRTRRTPGTASSRSWNSTRVSPQTGTR